MRVYQCMCGKVKEYSAAQPAPCSGCAECGSNLCCDSDSFSEPEPHKYQTCIDEETGDKYELCLVCLKSKDEIEAQIAEAINK
jgi:hypothetical protein